MSGPSDNPIIRLRNIRKAFGPLVVLDDVSLDIPRGVTTVVIGPSGAGKSVLLKHMIGLLRPDAGRVFFDGQDVTAWSERRLSAVRRRVGFLFQGGALFDSMTVAQNVCFPMVEHDIGTPQGRQERAAAVLRLVGLDGMQEQMPEELSGGQKKRVALARAIVLEPEVILYDEPTAGLDPVRADVISELILRLQRELKTTAVVVTHDMRAARKVGDRLVMLDRAKLLCDVRPDQVDALADPAIQQFVRGQAPPEEMQNLSGRPQGPRTVR